MGTRLRDLALVAAVTALGASVLIRSTRPPSHGSAASALPLASKRDAPKRHAPISFSALGDQEQIRVRLASRGCYHDFDHEFVFTPATNGAAGLSHLSRRNNLIDGAHFVAPSHLSASALAQLDALVAYFRTPTPLPTGRICRVNETVELSLYRYGIEVAMERFVGTCGSPDEQVLTFGRLLRIERGIAAPPQN